MINDSDPEMSEIMEQGRWLEEEVGSCRCNCCKEGAVVLKVTDTWNDTFDYFSNCCEEWVDVAYTDVVIGG